LGGTSPQLVNILERGDGPWQSRSRENKIDDNKVDLFGPGLAD